MFSKDGGSKGREIKLGVLGRSDGVPFGRLKGGKAIRMDVEVKVEIMRCKLKESDVVVSLGD